MFEFVRPEWQDHAVCAGVDPDLWFPDKSGDVIQTIREAKAVCHRCPVRVDCLEFALEHGEQFGIWGGKTVKERRAIRRQRAQGLRVVA